jgi:L-alanine-DL-glutamate epimerase-like enolase superfamily enzyme
MCLNVHMAESPIACFAAVHCAAATENFLVLENHDVDNPEWGDLVDGVPKPIVQNGFTKLPEGPGLGITINDEALKKQITEPGMFEPTPQWNQKARVNDRLWI